MEQFSSLEDSTLSIEKTKIIAEMDAKFKTVKKQAKIEVLNKAHQVDQWKLTGLIISSIALVGFLFFQFQKRKKDKLIFVQEKEIEYEKRKVVEKELEFKQKELTSKVLQLA